MSNTEHAATKNLADAGLPDPRQPARRPPGRDGGARVTNEMEDVDPASIWEPLDRLVRTLLPATLEALGFATVAEQLRALASIDGRNAADGLRAVRRELSSQMYAEHLALNDHAIEMAASNADEIEVILARRKAHDPRFARAGLLLGLVLDVYGSWAITSTEPPGPWPTARQSAAICMRGMLEVAALLGFSSAGLRPCRAC